MRRIWFGTSVAFLLLTSISCGGEDKVPILSGSPNNNNNHPKTDGGALPKDAGDNGNVAIDSGVDAGKVNPLAPVVKILAPESAEDPNDDTLITTGTVKIECQAKRSALADARPIDGSTVRIEAHYAPDLNHPDKFKVLTAPVDAGEDNTYVAEFNISGLPNGPVEFVCSAKDTGAPAIVGTGTLHSLIDLGPEIELLEPKDGSVLALKTPVQIKFRVNAAEVLPGDDEAKPTHISLIVSGQETKVEEDKDDRGSFSASIDFGDATLFPMAPDTAQIIIGASNKRTPDAPVREVISNIKLDSEGPAIKVQSPSDGAVVRGEVVLSVKISDPSGVKPDSVVATINKDLYTLNHWTVKGDIYSERFDTRPFGEDLTQLTIEISAQDKVGNEAINKASLSHTLYLDNVPPLVSIDPPQIQERILRDDETVCSLPFDPVGDDATNDLDTKPASSLYRVLIWERTNHSQGAEVDHGSVVAPATAVLYAQGDPSIPLLIDTDGDGVCDDINVDVEDNQGHDLSPTKLALKPVTPTGNAYYSKDLVAGGGCNPGSDTKAPAQLCGNNTPMTRVIAQAKGPGGATIYASGQGLNKAGGPACAGDSWELLGILGEGWACLAARAEDAIGNVGVSVPIRVCLDSDPLDTDIKCDFDHPPSCVKNCTLPDAWPPNVLVEKP